MKTHPTIAGNAYVVFSQTGCTVTDSTGTLNKEVPAGDWMTIPAPSDALILDDDNAIVRNANFKLALAPSSVGSGGGSTGGGEPEGDYLLFNADRSLKAGRMDNWVDGTYLFYNAKNQKSWTLPLPNLEIGDHMFYSAGLTSFTATLPKLKNANYLFSACPLSEEFVLELPLVTTANYGFQYTAFKKAKIDMPSLKGGEAVFNNSKVEEFEGDFSGVTNGRVLWYCCYYLRTLKVNLANMTTADSTCYDCRELASVEINMPKLSNAPGMFGNCQLNKESALRILDNLQTFESGTHKLTLGIHVDHKFDEEVLAAIALADIAQTPVSDGGKGWSLIIQWNGTASAASASTYNWRGRRDPVYAKLAEPFENEPPVLDWGHYVTDWEENGYMEFASLEEAREYFNIAE